MVRATPTGISGIIDARGNVVEKLPQHELGVIDARLPAAAAPTLFAQFGNWLPFLFAALLIGASWLTTGRAGRLPSGAKAANEPAT